MEKIKIGKTEYMIQKGDYILYNGSCYQFCSGDGRTLYHKNYTHYNNVVISNSLVKKIDLDNMRKITKHFHGMEMTYYYF
jgi:hypothetical protein